MAKKDFSIIGERFGKLTVLSFDHRDSFSGTYWLCECDCGEHVIVRKDVLRRGDKTSCGCERCETTRNRLIGQRYGRLTVVEYDHERYRPGKIRWICRCDCGNYISVSSGDLSSGHTTSCGCYRHERLVERASTHRMSDTRLYKIWAGMLKRCENENSVNYDRYGGRGIFVYDAWHHFEDFYEWAIKNGYDDDLSIDRIDNNDGYYPENCRWVDDVTQANNKRSSRFVTYLGNRHTIAEWARIMNVSDANLRYHIKHGDAHDFEEYFGEIDDDWFEG